MSEERQQADQPQVGLAEGSRGEPQISVARATGYDVEGDAPLVDSGLQATAQDEDADTDLAADADVSEATDVTELRGRKIYAKADFTN